jgi:hypothetical protein
MEIGIITDEISADFETAVELGDWGAQLRLRSCFTSQPNLSAYQKQCVRMSSMNTVPNGCIGPGLFKDTLPASRPLPCHAGLDGSQPIHELD